jgi:hypothetical protein
LLQAARDSDASDKAPRVRRGNRVICTRDAPERVSVVVMD